MKRGILEVARGARAIHIAPGLIAFAVFATGCKGPESAQSKYQDSLPPPPQTANEVLARIQPRLLEINRVAPSLSPDTPIPAEFRNSTIESLSAWKEEYGNTAHGKQAVVEVVRWLEEHLRLARDNSRPHVVALMADLLETLDPENIRIQRYREWASVYLRRPIVALKGFFEDLKNERIVIFLKVYMPATGEIHEVEVEEGDEFLGLKLDRIVGKKRGIDIIYLETEDTFRVYAPFGRQHVDEPAPASTKGEPSSPPAL